MQRTSAREALASEFFREAPAPVPPELFPSFPARSEGNARGKKVCLGV
jgi:hypothetical protein